MMSVSPEKGPNGWFYPMVAILPVNALMALLVEVSQHTRNVEMIVIKMVASAVILPLLFIGIAFAFLGSRGRVAYSKSGFIGGAVMLFSLIMQMGMGPHE